MRKNTASSKVQGYEVIDFLNVNPYDDETVFRRGECLCFRYHRGFRGAGPSVIYDIPLDWLDTPTKVYHWIIHLLQKDWITRDMLFRMVCILQVHFHYNLHEPVQATQNTKP